MVSFCNSWHIYPGQLRHDRLQEFELHKASRCAFTYKCTSQRKLFLTVENQTETQIAFVFFVQGIDRRRPQTDFETMPPRRDEGQVRISEACASPAWTAQSSHNCLQATPNATSLFADIVSSRVKVRAISAGPLSSLRSGPRLIVKVFTWLVHDRFLEIPDASSARHGIASRLNTR